MTRVRWLDAPTPILAAGALLAAGADALIPWNHWEFALPGSALLPAGVTALTFESPSWIILGLIIGAPYLLQTVRASLVATTDSSRWLQFATRMSLLLALAATLSDPRVHTTTFPVTDIIVMDVSDSMSSSQRARASAMLTTRFDARDRERDAVFAGLGLDSASNAFFSVRFGHEINIGEERVAMNITARPASDPGTSSELARALRTAAHLGHPDGPKRITILSDGEFSPAESERTRAEVRTLVDAGAAVRVAPINEAPSRNIGIVNVILPEGLRIGQRFDATVQLQATHAGTVDLSITGPENDGSARPSVRLQLHPGDNEATISAMATVGGPAAYTLRIDDVRFTEGADEIPDDDTWTEVTNIARRLQVLIISDAMEPPIKGVLERSELDVTVVTPREVPRAAEALARYDLFVVHDVPATRLDRDVQRTITELIDVEGVGLLVLGGPQSYGPGGWQGTPIYDALPVRVSGEKRRQTPNLALMLVLDKSGSMTNEDKLDLAKRAARGSAQALEATDEIGVIAFDSRPSVLVRLQPASARLRIRSDIQRVRAGGGTNVLPALREAFLQLAGSDAKIKHVIVLSDGQSPEAGVATLVQQMRDANITVSGVGVGSGAGKTLLRRIARVGAGRYYFSLDGSDVPSIFQRETREVSKNMIRETRRFAQIRKYAQVLRGLRLDGAPPLRGITPLSPRRNAEVLLETDRAEPLLIRGRFGLGRTYAFASDSDPRWARAWLSWPGFGRLWSQVARDAARPGEDAYGGARLEVLPTQDSGAWRIRLDVHDGDRYRDDLSCVARLIHPSDPSGPGRSLSLTLVAPGRYAGTIRDVASTPTLIQVTARDGSKTQSPVVATATTSLPTLVSQERRAPLLNASDAWLRGMQRAGAEVVRDLTQPWPMRAQGTTARRSIPCWRVLLWILVIPLFLLDLAVRRIDAARSS
jgi:Mg-chelatase subunit ChlD